MLLTIVADVLFSVANLEGTYLAARLLDFFYPASYLLTGVAGIISMLPMRLERDKAVDSGRLGLHRHLTALMLGSGTPRCTGCKSCPSRH
jgi:hypothetical protein